jgi:hypothetical protein
VAFHRRHLIHQSLVVVVVVVVVVAAAAAAAAVEVVLCRPTISIKKSISFVIVSHLNWFNCR